MRRLLTSAWLAGHVLVAVAVVGMLWLGVWQYGRATAGNALSWGYTLQWPLFAGFTAFLWVREVRRRLRGEAGATPSADGRPPATRVSPTDERRETAPRSGPEPAIRPAVRQPVVTRRAVSVSDEDDPELAAYNDYLAWLNANPGARPADYPGRK